MLLGLSDSGGLPGLSASRQGHPGARVPRADRSYGISLTFRLGRDAHADRRGGDVGVWRGLWAPVVAAVSGGPRVWCGSSPLTHHLSCLLRMQCEVADA